MALLPHNVDDFVALTLPEFKRGSWTDLALEYTEYVSAQLLSSKSVVEQGGPSISFRIKTRNTGNARTSGLFDQDITKVEDVMISASVPWAKQTTNFSYDVDEPEFQSDRETIIKILQIRKHDAESDMAELMEQLFWSAPTSSTDAKPFGIPFWIQKSSTTPAGGHTGGNPGGFAAGCAGVSSTDYPRWRNWSFNYTQPTTDDLVKKVKKALAFTNFVAPVPHPELGFGKSDYNIYTTYRVMEPLERLAETRNDNLGSDLAKYIGTVTIGGVPVKWVPYLEANDTSDPLYGVNWRTLRPIIKKGANMRLNPPIQGARQHTTRTVHIDNWMNWIAYNRRLLWVGYVA